MSTVIAPEHPDTLDAQMLIAELDSYLIPKYPSESRHGYSVDKLIQEQVAFFVLRQDDIPAACGGVKLFDEGFAEIKRMYVRSQFRGLGFAKMMLSHLAEYAKQHGISTLRLETGIYQTEAIGLYERSGFEQIGPFGSYKSDPLSVFFEKRMV